MEIELKHSLEVSRTSWFIRLYRFVWCDTAKVRGQEHQITFCSLFWGYVFMPLGLILTPLVYGLKGGIRAGKLGAVGLLYACEYGWRALVAIRVIWMPVLAISRRIHNWHINTRLASSSEKNRRAIEKAQRDEDLIWLRQWERDGLGEEWFEKRGVPATRVARLLTIKQDLDREMVLAEARKLAAEERAEAWKHRRRVAAKPVAVARQPILAGVSFGAARIIMAARGFEDRAADWGEHLANGVLRMGRGVGMFWRTTRWPILVMIGLGAFTAAGYGVFLLAPLVAWLAIATAVGIAWLAGQVAAGVAWFAVATFHALLWFTVTTFWSLLWFFVHTGLAIGWFFAAGIPAAFMTAVAGVGDAAAASWLYALLAVGGGLAAAVLLLTLSKTVAHLIAPTAKAVRKGATGAVLGTASGISLFGQAMKIGYVAVKSNTCPKIVLKDD